MDMTFQEIGVFGRSDRPSLTVFTESYTLFQSYYIVTQCIQINRILPPGKDNNRDPD